MSRKGGYQILDFKNIPINMGSENAVKIEGLSFNNLEKIYKNKKAVLVSGLYPTDDSLGPLADFYTMLDYRNDVFLIHENSLPINVKINSNDEITYEEL